MEKYKLPEEYELQKVENQISPRNKYVTSSDFTLGYFSKHPFMTSSPRFLSSPAVEPFFSNASAYSPQRTEFLLSPRKPKRCIEVCIFFANKVGVTLELEDGHIATADELLHFVVTEEEVHLPAEATSVFSLWFVSPFLEVQLKPHHLPYKVRYQWRELLSKYSTLQDEDLDLDEPILSFQRNVFYPRKDEMKILNYQILELLYEEAKNNVLNGRYPCTEGNYCMLAGLQARIQLGPYSPDVHTLHFFRNKMNQFLPNYAHRSKWSIFKWGINKKNGTEAKILETFCNISSEITTQELQKKYLQFCWTLPYYGAAFFHGTIEKPCWGLIALLGSQEREILIAINEDGVYLICQYENVVLLGLKYEELCWEHHNPSIDDSNVDCRPCLFLQFTITENEKKVLKLIQIFSQQAVMMDALITTFVNEIKQKQTREKNEKSYVPKRNMDENILYSDPVEVDEVNVSNSKQELFSEVLEPLTSVTAQNWTVESQVSNQLHRLSLVTFNEDGECIDPTTPGIFAK